MPVDSASRFRGLPTARPYADGKLAGILPATLRAFPPPARRDLEGTREEQSAAVPAAEAFFSFVGAASAAIEGVQVRSRLKPLLHKDNAKTLCEAAKVGRTRPRAPHAVRARTARIWRQGRMPCRQTPADRSEPAALRPARNRGCISLVTFFLCASKESDSPARDGGRSPTGTNATPVRRCEKSKGAGSPPSRG